jgi:hypothetical protein
MFWKILTSLDTACGHDELLPLILFTHVASTSVTSHTPISGFLLIFADCQVLSSHTSPTNKYLPLLLESSKFNYVTRQLNYNMPHIFHCLPLSSPNPPPLSINPPFTKEYALAQLVEALRYNPEGRGFDS